MTSDDKYVISCSSDFTVRIWNLLEKTQETVLQGHNYHVTRVIVTCDNKYIISGSKDKSIRIWNLLEKKTKSILNFDDWITLLEVDKEYKLTVYSGYGIIRTINLKEFI